MPPKRILYIQHATTLGGSCVSLLTTLKGLDSARFEGMVAVSTDAPRVAEYYESASYRVVKAPKLPFWNHTTGGSSSLFDPRTWMQIFDVAWNWRAGGEATLALKSETGADLIHLNSIVLSASAAALHNAGVPYVWHVREHPPCQGHRTSFLRRQLVRAGHRAVFISEADRGHWLGEAATQAAVIRNFVEPAAFRSPDRTIARSKFGFDADAKVVLFVGGLSQIKGVLPFLQCLPALRDCVPNLRVLLPSFDYHPPNTLRSRVLRRTLPMIGSGTVGQRAHKLAHSPALADICTRIPYQTDMGFVYAAADLLVFPAERPHFARPVIEAAARGVPSVASRLAGMDELIIDAVTGRLVPAHSPNALSLAIAELLSDDAQRLRMGHAAYEHASARFHATRAIRNLMALYDRVLSSERERPELIGRTA